MRLRARGERVDELVRCYLTNVNLFISRLDFPSCIGMSSLLGYYKVSVNWCIGGSPRIPEKCLQQVFILLCVVNECGTSALAIVTGRCLFSHLIM